MSRPFTETQPNIWCCIYAASHLLTYFIFDFDLFPTSSSASNRATSSSLVSYGMKKEETNPQRLIILLYKNMMPWMTTCAHSIHYIKHPFSQGFVVYICIHFSTFLQCLYLILFQKQICKCCGSRNYWRFHYSTCLPLRACITIYYHI